MIRSILCAAATGVLVLAFAPPGLAVTGSTSAGDVSITVTVNDAAFTGPDCLDVPVQATFSGSGSLELAASQPGSSNSVATYIYSGEAGTVNDVLQVCPYLDGAGTYVLRGSLTGDSGSAPLPDGLEFQVTRAPTQITGLSARQKADILTIKGKATATSDRGPVGADGDVTLFGMLSKKAGGKGTWTKIGSAYVDEFGAFMFRGRTTQRLKGAAIRAELAPRAWTREASATAKVR